MTENKPFVRNGEKLRFQTKNGYICENAKENCFRVARYTTCFEDGFVGSAIAETVINYKTGLYTYSSPHDYYANYFDAYKGKRNAMRIAKRDLGVVA